MKKRIPIKPNKKALGYFRARAWNMLQECVLQSVIDYRDEDGKHKDIAKALGLGESRVSRMIHERRSLSIDSASDLLLTLGLKLEIRVERIRPIFLKKIK